MAPCFFREPPAQGAVIPKGYVEYCLFGEASYLTFHSRQRAKSCFPRGTKLSHVKVDAAGKAGG
uniref:Uncharacterized protein n=1 Tax=Escherichia coli TaxID=562 RepID=A0A2R4KLL1_ECOLX|nr:Hypothetical protein [Escherichia coli]